MRKLTMKWLVSKLNFMKIAKIVTGTMMGVAVFAMPHAIAGQNGQYWFTALPDDPPRLLYTSLKKCQRDNPYKAKHCMQFAKACNVWMYTLRSNSHAAFIYFAGGNGRSIKIKKFGNSGIFCKLRGYS